MGFSSLEYWSGLPFPSPRDIPDPGFEPASPSLRADAFTLWAAREAVPARIMLNKPSKQRVNRTQSFTIQFQKHQNISQNSLPTPKPRKMSREKKIKMPELTEKATIIKSLQKAIMNVFKPTEKYKNSANRLSQQRNGRYKNDQMKIS